MRYVPIAATFLNRGCWDYINPEIDHLDTSRRECPKGKNLYGIFTLFISYQFILGYKVHYGQSSK